MKVKPATPAQAEALRIAHAMLCEARKHLVTADCPQTLERVRLAIASAKGAQRHMDRRVQATRVHEQEERDYRRKIAEGAGLTRAPESPEATRAAMGFRPVRAPL